jgi:hypothetical protein
MITSLTSFARFAKSAWFCDKCIGFMEKGVLHVDTINEVGMTIGFYLIRHSLDSDQWLWDRYWALGPSVPFFWKLALSGPLVGLVLDEFTHSSRRLRETSVLWEDLGLVYSFAHMMPAWIRREVRKRIRDSVRFAWIAVIVC